MGHIENGLRFFLLASFLFDNGDKTPHECEGNIGIEKTMFMISINFYFVCFCVNNSDCFFILVCLRSISRQLWKYSGVLIL